MSCERSALGLVARAISDQDGSPRVILSVAKDLLSAEQILRSRCPLRRTAAVPDR
jgi:hypothetical protein